MNATATPTVPSEWLKAGRRMTPRKKIKNRAVRAAQVAEQVAEDMAKAIYWAADGELAEWPVAGTAFADAREALDSAATAAKTVTELNIHPFAADNVYRTIVADANAAAVIAIAAAAELTKVAADTAAADAKRVGETARDITEPMADAVDCAYTAANSAEVAACLAQAIAAGARRLTATAIERKLKSTHPAIARALGLTATERE